MPEKDFRVSFTGPSLPLRLFHHNFLILIPTHALAKGVRVSVGEREKEKRNGKRG